MTSSAELPIDVLFGDQGLSHEMIEMFLYDFVSKEIKTGDSSVRDGLKESVDLLFLNSSRSACHVEYFDSSVNDVFRAFVACCEGGGWVLGLSCRISVCGQAMAVVKQRYSISLFSIGLGNYPPIYFSEFSSMAVSEKECLDLLDSCYAGWRESS